MFTVVETPTFSKLAGDYWSEEERGQFAAWIAVNPESGDVVPGTGGVRKVRWSRRGTGKSGGMRIIYFNRLANGEVWLLLMYAKSARDNIPAHFLKAIKEEVEYAID